MAVPDWSLKKPEWSSETYRLLIDNSIEKLEKQTIENIITNSEKFPIKFPVSTGRCKTLKSHVSEEILEKNINSVYPVVHENALELFCKFILFKRSKGSSIEKEFYKSLSLKEFIDRLLKKRAVMFMGKLDKYVLLNGKKGEKNWETIGTEKENPPLVLKDCLSYEEVKLSVFLSVSSYTYFVNGGERKNMAKYATNRENIAKEGVIVGMIGPRLKKLGVMEYQEIVASKNQNTKQNGYGTTVDRSLHKLFSDFYGEKCLDYDETIKAKTNSSQRYVQLNANSIFDNHIYHKRLTLSIDTLLFEANFRAKMAETNAFVHVVGLGLGVWVASPHQEKVFMDSFAQRISAIGKNLTSVSDICFSWINQEKCGNYKDGETFRIDDHPLGGIKILINKRNPHQKLNEEKLLVVSYAWDGNALPGNEYWSGKLGSSGDSAAASSTQIAEIHNTHINPLVRADNLKIISDGGKVVSFDKYQEMVRCQNHKRVKK